MVENLPANAGDTGWSPDPGSSHVPRSNEARAPQLLSLSSRACKPQLLSPQAPTTEARMPRACAPQQREAKAMRSPHTTKKGSPRSPQLERKPACRNEDPTQPKIIN